MLKFCKNIIFLLLCWVNTELEQYSSEFTDLVDLPFSQCWVADTFLVIWSVPNLNLEIWVWVKCLMIQYWVRIETTELHGPEFNL